jgi:hypothetical protein
MHALILAVALLGQSNPYVVEVDPATLVETESAVSNPYVVEVEPTVFKVEDKVLKAETEILKTKLQAARERREYFEKHEDPERFGTAVPITPTAPAVYQQPTYHYPQAYGYATPTYYYSNGTVCGPGGCAPATTYQTIGRGLFGIFRR